MTCTLKGLTSPVMGIARLGENLISNSDFAGGSTSSWTIYNAGSLATNSSDLPSGNTSGYKLVCTSGDGGYDRAIYDTAGLLTIGKVYRLEFWQQAGAQPTGSSGAPALKTMDIDGQDYRDMGTTGSWTKYSEDLTATTTGGEIQLATNLGGGLAGDTLELTDITLREVL